MAAPEEVSVDAAKYNYIRRGENYFTEEQRKTMTDVFTLPDRLQMQNLIG